jgi:hypothetical protein
MKPTTLFFSLLSALGVSALSALPSFSQTTTIPVTGLVSVSVFASGGTAITYQSVLSSLGTISVSNAQLTSFAPIQVAGLNLSVGDVIGMTGTSTGNINFNAGGSANFSNAPTSLTVIPTRVSGVIPYFGPVNPDQNFDATFNGSVVIPNSSITGGSSGSGGSVPPTVTGVSLNAIPIISGSFSTTEPGEYFNATALTSLGTIIFSSVTGGEVTIPAIGFTSIGISNTSRLPAAGDVFNISDAIASGAIARQPFTKRLPAAGDVFNISDAIASGTIARQPFTNSPLSVTGVIQPLSQPDPNVYLLTVSITGGTIGLPSSLITSLSGGSSNSPISQLIAINDETAKKILNAQPVLEGSRNFLPPSSLANSRIHPGLGR